MSEDGSGRAPLFLPQVQPEQQVRQVRPDQQVRQAQQAQQVHQVQGRAGPLRGGEPVALEAPDGAILRGELILPPGTQAPRVAVALSHAMMVDRRTLDLPRGAGLLSQLVRAGAAVLWFDQRGHGQSTPSIAAGARWDYDALVRDTGLVAAELARRFPGLPRVAVGHSLFGHVALAWQTRVLADAGAGPGATGATGAPGFDALVLLGGNVWLPALEPRWWRWLAKRATTAVLPLLYRLSPTRDYVPVRRLGLGTCDEPAPYFAQLADWARRGDWTDRDGRSFQRALGRVRVPVLSVAGAGDRLLSVPACQLRFARATAGAVTHWVVGRRFGDRCDPDHMGLVLDRRLQPVWRGIAAWVAGVALRPDGDGDARGAREGGETAGESGVASGPAGALRRG